MTNLEKAKEVLEKESCSVVFCKDDVISKDFGRGIAPLLQRIDSGESYAGYSVADKIVGKAAAFLFLELEIKEVYAQTISKQGKELLETKGIPVSYGTLVDVIRNRTNTGMCPMEQTVINVDNGKEAVILLRDKVQELRSLNS